MAYIPLTEYIIETLLKPYGIEIMLPEKMLIQKIHLAVRHLS